MSRTASAVLNGKEDNLLRVKLSAWIREQNELGNVPVNLFSNSFEEAARHPVPGIQDRASALLLRCARDQKRLGQKIWLYDPMFLAATYASDDSEHTFFVHWLQELGWIDNLDMSGKANITPAGVLKSEELQRIQSASIQAFVAMWFDPALSDLYKFGIAKGIEDAGFRPLRIDNVEHLGKIDDEIIAQIRKSRFVVADFTGHRGGVYFEAGFAHGLGLPVIWTCREDDLPNLHFDIRQYNCLTWKVPTEVATLIKNRIEATIGVGPIKLA